MQERNPARGLLPVRQIVDDGSHLGLAQNVPERRHACERVDSFRLSYPLAQPFGVPGCPDSRQIGSRRCPFSLNHVARGTVGPQHQGCLPLAAVYGRRLNPNAFFPHVRHDRVGLAGTETPARRWAKARRNHLGIPGVRQQPLLVPSSSDLGNWISSAAWPVARHTADRWRSPSPRSRGDSSAPGRRAQECPDTQRR